MFEKNPFRNKRREKDDCVQILPAEVALETMRKDFGVAEVIDGTHKDLLSGDSNNNPPVSAAAGPKPWKQAEKHANGLFSLARYLPDLSSFGFVDENADRAAKKSGGSANSSMVHQLFQFTSSSQGAARGRAATVHPEAIINKRSSNNVCGAKSSSGNNKKEKSSASGGTGGKEKSSWIDFISSHTSSWAAGPFRHGGHVAPAEALQHEDEDAVHRAQTSAAVVANQRSSDGASQPSGASSGSGGGGGGLEDNLWAEFCSKQKTTGANWKAPTLTKQQCLICASSVWSSKLACIEFPCGHVGHFQCMQAEWWKGRDREGRIAPACPACRHPLSSIQTRAMYDRLIQEGVVDRASVPALHISVAKVAQMRSQDVTASFSHGSKVVSGSNGKISDRAKSAVGGSRDNSIVENGPEMFVKDAPSF